MASEVLLMSDIEGLGAQGEIVKVAEGYARNYLLPQKLAAPVSEAARRRLEKLKAAAALREQENQAQAEKTAKSLEGVSITLAVKTSEEGSLYGSVSAADIADALAAQGYEVDRHQVALEHPIKELGVFDVPLKLSAQTEQTVKVWIIEEEA